MTGSAEVVAELERQGVDLVTGVPCSYFAGVIRLLERHPRMTYVPAANEGSALAIAAGAQLAGGRAVVLAQNSGFGNLINPLTSLVLPYRIPLLVMMSMRGWPRAEVGAPQHLWMGRVVPGWLDSLEVPHLALTAGGASPAAVLQEAGRVRDARQTVFVLVGKEAIRTDDAGGGRAGCGADGPADAARRTGPVPRRDDVVAAVLDAVDDEPVLATTGYLSRALFKLGDRPRNFYMQGSMGHVGGLALGAALARPAERFVVLDGDGAMLMHLGTLATVGHLAPRNLVHVVFDNGVYESTGEQPTGASAVRFAVVARGCGYRHVRQVSDVAGLRPAIRAALTANGPALVAVSGRTGGATGDRASGSLDVAEIAARFAASLDAPAGALS